MAKPLTIPDKLTFIRIIILPFFLAATVVNTLEARIAALVLFVIAVLTDAFDGTIARKLNICSRFGTFLDPLADKLIVSAALISFVQLSEVNVPAWMVVLIISREFIITGLRLLAMSHNRVIAASRAGKFKMTTQTIVIIAILVILVVNSVLAGKYSMSASMLLDMTGWRYYLGVFLTKFPYWMMLYAALFTVYSGIVYMYRNIGIIKLEFESR